MGIISGGGVGGGGGVGPSLILGVSAPADLGAGYLGNVPQKWNQAFDNEYDFNPLTALPAGLGLTFAIDGSDATITATESGYWWFELGLGLLADATFAGFTGLRNGSVGVEPLGPGVTLGAGEPDRDEHWGAVVSMPAGATDYFNIQVLTAATSGSYVPLYVVGAITRLG